VCSFYVVLLLFARSGLLWGKFGVGVVFLGVVGLLCVRLFVEVLGVFGVGFLGSSRLLLWLAL